MKSAYRYFVLLFVVVLILVGCSQYKVYSVKDSPKIPISGGVLYALPKTELCIALTVERRDISNAPYVAYASEMIGVDNVDTNYHIVNIDVTGNNVADPEQYFFVKVRKGSLTVDDRQLLLAIGELKIENGELKIENRKRGTGNGERKAENDNENRKQGCLRTNENGERRTEEGEYNLYDRFDTLYTRYDMPGRPTFVSSRKDSRSVRQRALASAERLGEVQEKMQQLLNGEYEGSYSAESVRFIYSKLKEQEQSVIASFCGEMKRETVKIYVDPTFRRNETVMDTVAWFSETEGLSFDASRSTQEPAMTPIVCSVQPLSNLRKASRFVKYHTSGVTQNGAAGHSGTAAAKKREGNNFRYRVPEKALVSVSAESFNVSTEVPVLQIGAVMALPRHRVTAVFDPQTLELIYFNRKSEK